MSGRRSARETEKRFFECFVCFKHIYEYSGVIRALMCTCEIEGILKCEIEGILKCEIEGILK